MCFDIDKDGYLNVEEFALAKYLIKLKLDDHELPTTLPDHLYPPSMYSYRPIKDNDNGGDAGSAHSIPSAANGAV